MSLDAVRSCMGTETVHHLTWMTGSNFTTTVRKRWLNEKQKNKCPPDILPAASHWISMLAQRVEKPQWIKWLMFLCLSLPPTLSLSLSLLEGFTLPPFIVILRFATVLSGWKFSLYAI